MNPRRIGVASWPPVACMAIGAFLALPGCSGDGGGYSSSSVSVGYGYYGSYYGGGYYYDPYPPVIIDGPDDRPDRPNSGERPTTLPSEVGGSPSAKSSMAPSRPTTSSRATTRPSPRPAPRPMPRAGGMRR